MTDLNGNCLIPGTCNQTAEANHYTGYALSSDPTALIAERNQTHGSFVDNARISQQLKDYFRIQAGYQMLTDIDREALDNIAIKLSRILSSGVGGKHFDNWDDIAGYATLASNEKRGILQERP